MSDETDTTPEPLDPAALQARVDQLEKQAADYKALIADFENARKRLTQDADRQRRYAAEPLARDLLAGLDNLDRAVQAATQAGGSGALVQGVTATIALFLDVLKRHGVRRVDVAPGSAFDPHVHEAVMQLPTNDYDPGTVVQVVQPGFLLHDRVLRPASVVVASEPPAGGSND
ncbi:MAG TPA: nucleotide exchange factor GrpE [Fimbriiglobus sp.]|nr:nucleotide exchange factor GrpE [Fimbriiglobus sp.]